MLETRMERHSSLEQLFANLNHSVNRTLNSRTFVCFQMAQIHPESRCLHLASAGCPYPFHYRATTGDVAELQPDGAYPLGIRLDSDYRVLEIQLDPGDRVVFCSDGIMEAENAREEIFGFDRTAAAIHEGCKQDLSAEDLLDRIVETVGDFTDDVPATDDRTCVVLEVRNVER